MTNDTKLSVSFKTKNGNDPSNDDQILLCVYKDGVPSSINITEPKVINVFEFEDAEYEQ